MKLCRAGKLGKEKPILIDDERNYRDLSSTIKDLNPSTLNFETLEKIKNLDIKKLPIMDKNLRIGACVSNPSKFIGIGLNFKDHALEQNLPMNLLFFLNLQTVLLDQMTIS
jgi:2-keto-4-pentenoate hydratase/2-oxohepta-3-ene-1,7-dioic acid hydratase in catechol pathway